MEMIGSKQARSHASLSKPHVASTPFIMASADYAAQQAAYSSLPAFSPPIPSTLVPFLSLGLLGGSFLLSFAFTTLPKKGSASLEAATAMLASVLFGFGAVIAFSWVGVSV